MAQNSGTSTGLDDSHYQLINRQLRDLARAKEDLARIAAGGTDCGDNPQLCDWLIDQYQRRKAAHFPNRP